MRAMLPLVPLALLAACSGSGPTAIEIPIAELEIVQGCGVIIAGERCQVQIRALTAEGQQIANPVLRWSSSNDAVASVSNRGLITAGGAGSVTIRVSNTTDTAKDETRIHVIPRTR
ncbi:MAG: Ig domain-containing protein [Gemmatimonadota bacterium]